MVALALTTLTCALYAVRGDRARGPANNINGVGLIDYSDRSAARLGMWCKYHLTGASELGTSDDYTVTIGIAGEERFWGEDCFWVETQTEPANGPPTGIAQLMSFDIFDDPQSAENLKYYMRKTIDAIDEQGNPIEVVTRRPPSTLTVREKIKQSDPLRIDTLSTDTTIVSPKGTFLCRHVRMNEGVGSSMDQRDSTIYTEVRETRDVYVSRQVPLTRIVMEDIDHAIQRRTWMIGRSKDAPMNIMDRSVGRAVLVDFGTNYQATMIREKVRHTIAEQDRPTPAKAKPGTPAPRPRARTGKSG
jgi:hypothetical protein